MILGMCDFMDSDNIMWYISHISGYDSKCYSFFKPKGIHLYHGRHIDIDISLSIQTLDYSHENIPIHAYTQYMYIYTVLCIYTMEVFFKFFYFVLFVTTTQSLV